MFDLDRAIRAWRMRMADRNVSESADIEEIQPNGPSDLVVGKCRVKPVAQRKPDDTPQERLPDHDALGQEGLTPEVRQPEQWRVQRQRVRETESDAENGNPRVDWTEPIIGSPL